jgi:WD40 repeat protein
MLAAAGGYRHASSIRMPACAHVDSLAWNRDGSRLVAAARSPDDRISVQIWRDGALERSFLLSPGIYAAAFSPDGALLAFADRSGRNNGIYLVDPATGATLRRLETNWPISALAFTPDGTTLAASPLGPETGLWRWNTRSWRGEKLPLGSQLGNYEQSLDFLPGGLVAISYAGGNAGLWDLRTGQLRRRFSARDGLKAEVLGGPASAGSDGKWLAMAYAVLPPEPTFLPYAWQIRIWDLRTGAVAANLRLDRDLESLAFRPGTSLLAVQLEAETGSLLLFEPGSWKQVQSLSWPVPFDTLAFGLAGGLALAGPAPGKSCRIEIWRDR